MTEPETPSGTPSTVASDGSTTILSTTNGVPASATPSTTNSTSSLPMISSSSATFSTPPLLQNPVQSDDPAVVALSEALLSTFKPALEQISNQLQEIQQSQTSLLATVSSEMAKFNTHSQDLAAATAAFAKLPEYDAKTQKVLKEINSINERIARLKRNTERLKMRKAKDDEEEAKRVQKMLEKEKQLLALPAMDSGKKL